MALSNAERQARYRAREKAKIDAVLKVPSVRPAPAKPADDNVSPPYFVSSPSEPRDLIEGGRELAVRLLDELSATTTHLGEIEDAIEAYTADDKDGRRRFAMLKAVNLSSRSAVLKNLAVVAKTLSEVATSGGKKADAADRATRAGKAGRFVTPVTPPKLIVNNR